MKTRIFSGFIFSVLLAAFCSGCATHYLWTEPNFNTWNEPTEPSRVRLFENKKDILVIYDEFSESREVVRTRAYLLEQNRERIRNCQRPLFISTNVPCALIPIPFVTAAEWRECDTFPFAVMETNHHAFMLFLGQNDTKRCELPVYNDAGKDVTKKVLLTPVFVTADLTLLGGLFGYWYLTSMSGVAGYNPSY